MIDGQGGVPILGRGGPPDPSLPTLHTCSDCGHQILIPAGLVAVAVQNHRRGCAGPKLADLMTRLDEIAGLIVHHIAEGDK